MTKNPRGKFDSKTTHYLRPDRSYVCGNSESPCSSGPSSSGTCPHQEVGCFPRISEGRFRKVIQKRVFLLFLGGLLLAIAAGERGGGNFEGEFISPGPLSQVHARFECSSCHSEELNSWSGIFSNAWHGTGDSLGSEGCLQCHAQDSNALYAHGVSPTELRNNSGFTEVEPFMVETECSACHSEHGHETDDQILSDARCQTCHQKQFSSFSAGHPEFSESYGNRVRSFAFSHSDHALRHFKTEPEHAPQSCSGCHELEPSTGAMALRPFEESCGSCHSSDIAKSNPIKFFALPTIFGLEEMEEEDMGVGDWPYIDALELTPWTRRWYTNSTLNGDFDDLMEMPEIEVDEPGNPLKAKQVQEFAMEIKRAFMEDMLQDLRSWINKMLPEASIERSTDDLVKLSGQFPRALLIKAQERWFPGLDQELNRFQKGLSVTPEKELTDLDSEELKETESPRKESTDDLLVEEDDLLLEEDDLLIEEDDLLVEEDDLLLEEDDLLVEEDDLLVEEDDLLSEEDDLLSEDDSDLLLEEDLLGDGSEQEESLNPISEDAKSYSLSDKTRGKDWANLGGWYEDAGVILYKSVQHADPFLMAWIQVELAHVEEDDVSREILSLLLNENAPGRCSKCHSGVSSELGTMHWKAHTDPNVNIYTHFSHASHVFSDDALQCNTCHEPRDKPSAHGHDWMPVKMSSCTSCHGQAVEDNCSLCHQYHASPKIRELNAISIDIFRIKQD